MTYRLKEEKIIRFLNNQSSREEKAEVLEWLDQPGSDSELEETLRSQWEKKEIDNPQEHVKYRMLLDKIHQATRGEGKSNGRLKVTRKLLDMGRVAATYALWLFSAYLLYQSLRPINPQALTEQRPVAVIERKTAAGEKLTIILPDQSKVTVNSLSNISFATDFGKSERVIQLDGEAYFEITPDQNRPFKVQTRDVTTTALGTAFNAYSRDGKVEIGLAEGKVRVSHQQIEAELNPGDMATLNNHNEGLKLERFDQDRLAWKEGEIRFRGKELGKIFLMLEEWYGVAITVQANVDQRRRVTGLFDNESLNDILTGLSFSLGFQYEIKGENVNIQAQMPME